MPLFAQFFGALFGALGGFLLKLFAAKIAMRVAGVGLLMALGAGMLTAFNTAIAPLIAQVFSHPFGQFLGLLFPPIAGSILTMLLTAWVSIKTYEVQRRAVELTASL